jgi:hypothetical protein
MIILMKNNFFVVFTNCHHVPIDGPQLTYHEFGKFIGKKLIFIISLALFYKVSDFGPMWLIGGQELFKKFKNLMLISRDVVRNFYPIFLLMIYDPNMN